MKIIPLREIGNHLRDRLIFMLFFATVFILGGYFVPKTYFRYFDKTQYYEVKLPIKVVNKTYYPCDYVDVLITRRALVSFKSEATVELRLYREDNSGVKDLITKQIRELSVVKSPTKDFNTVMSHWSLPCYIKPGRYLFEGGAPYVVNGEQKFTPLVTEDFIVHASPSAIIK